MDLRSRIAPRLFAAMAGALAARIAAGDAPREVDVGDAVRAAVAADWLDEDRRFVEEAKGRAPSFSLAHTRKVLERAAALAARLRPAADPARLGPPSARIEALLAALAEAEKRGDPGEPARRRLYLDARAAAREVAFANPLLDFDAILFVKRHHAGGVFHMCDQFYGFNARPGGGLFVLRGAFGPRPRLADLLEGAAVEKGRLAGSRLVPGSFLSPELSFDGCTVLFAYTEGRGKDLEWSPRASWHLFRVEADGTGLAQLTDGPWDDFDPCFLPSGRIAFISERRGGYLRCGRCCPVYTLHGMAADGSGIVRLSFHETHEWGPSVANDGTLLYTRWDYVDRDTNIAHHPWTCYPDGRDPRAIHGNYPARRDRRPWMEIGIRAIPGSRRLVATAAAHHGHAFGSLVLIDPEVPDDGALSPVTRLTPDVPFPEAEGKDIARCMAYGTAWPLGEDDHLCAYDPRAKDHGIYLIDRWGTRELIYRDPAIPSMSPIPLRPRPRPPVVPDAAGAVEEVPGRTGPEGPPATIAVVDVRDSDVRWPPGTKVSALRIIQVLPKTTAPPNEPRIGAAEQTNARAVLGTVPVEADGSACFEAPSGRLLYFQAVDERGLAITSMRSGTYAHPGERLVCQGCHEPKLRAPPGRPAPPLAFRGPPSRIEAETDGTAPFGFARLVQPVLDRACAGCHAEKKALDLRGVPGGPNGWTRSYANLAPRFGFYFDVTNGAIDAGVHGGSRTVPGKFGARASPLLPFLDARHHGVSLSPEDFRRITVWLDANSEFYGAYEATAAQARGEVVRPSLE